MKTCYYAGVLDPINRKNNLKERNIMPTYNDGRLFKKYKKKCDLFIETGTYIGEGIESALNAEFDDILSIELSSYHYNFCKNKFNNNNKVKILFGDSTLLLPDILKNKNSNILFWLDAHCSGGNTSGLGVIETLNKELELLKYANITNCSLLLDDMNDELIKFYSEKCKNLFNVKSIFVEDGYQEHINNLSKNTILCIEIE